MQHEVTDVQKLLDKQGYVVTPGWARRPVWQYNRENIAAPSFRIKEWDYYLAGNEHYAVAFTLSDLGYAGLISVSLIDLVERKEHTETILTAMSYHPENHGKHTEFFFYAASPYNEDESDHF